MTQDAPIFTSLPGIPGGWSCVVCDFPAHFSTFSAKGQGRAPSQHYQDHPFEALMTLPLEAVLARDVWLFLWLPDPHATQISEVMEALGFEFSGKAFTWVKTLRSLTQGPRLLTSDNIESLIAFGLGKTTRKQTESCWLGRRGKPAILSHSVREAIVAPRREHSRKPDEFYRRVEQFCTGPRLDLFGRESRFGWTGFGDELTKFDPPPALEAAS